MKRIEFVREGDTGFLRDCVPRLRFAENSDSDFAFRKHIEDAGVYSEGVTACMLKGSVLRPLVLER